MAKKTKYGTYVFLLLIVAIALYNYLLHIPRKPSSSLTKPDFHIAARDLAGLFGNDEPQADQRYMNKIISVSGIITTIQKDELGDYTISLGSHSNLPASISCTLDPTYIPSHIFLRAGDSATIRGTYVGQAHDLVLADCIIEK
jgi:putative nucleic acid binding protein